jgi:hypothetical protein
VAGERDCGGEGMGELSVSRAHDCGRACVVVGDWRGDERG